MKNITTKELNQKLNSNEDFQVIDVRSASEWQSGHIDDARVLNIDINSIHGNLDKIRKDCEVFLICASGGRSQIAQMLISKQGFNVINVSGGMNSWISNNYKISF